MTSLGHSAVRCIAAAFVGLVAPAPAAAQALPAQQATGSAEVSGSADLAGPSGLAASSQIQAPPESTYRLGDGLRGIFGPVDLRLRARVHADLVVPYLDDFEDALDTEFGTVTDIRRARALIDARGTEASGFENLRMRAQLGFANSGVRWFDLYVRVDDVLNAGPIEQSNLRAGEFREPFGLEAMTSVTYLPFIERSTPTNAFTPGRSRGAQVSTRTSNALVQLGVFRRSDGLPFPDDLLDESAVTGRAVWQPGGPGLVQLGGSLSVRDPRGELLVFRARTGSRFLDRFADTESIEADAATTAGVEALWSRGRWTAQTEWFGNWIEGANGEPGDSFLYGGYVSFAAFLGEGSSTWHRMRGALRAPSVPDAFTTRENGDGAVQAVARISWTDLVDGSVDGGRVLDVEAGVNWYLTSTTRVMLHWLGVHADVDGGGSEFGSAILGRIQFQI